MLATVVIEERRRYNVKDVFVTWKPIHIVRLATAAMVREVTPRTIVTDVEGSATEKGETSASNKRLSAKRVDEMHDNVEF